MMNLHEYMEQLRGKIDAYLIALLERPTEAHKLSESMIYSVKSGKRLRPILLLMTLEAFGVSREKGLGTASALEMIHTYSLIHDDLPAMDDDDLRRGKPTNHKVYGEAMAILAGDALLTDAFRVIAKDEQLTVAMRLELIQFLSVAAGAHSGMITGQVLDIEAETNPVSLEELKQIHNLKTGRLIEFSCLVAGMIAEKDNVIMSKLSQFAGGLGLAFQIQDDILDVEGDTAKIGKLVGSDEANGKSTYVSLLGLEGAKRMLADETNAALEVLDKLPADTNMLKELTLYVASRDK